MSQKTEETNHFQYKHTFYDHDHICWISNFTTIVPLGNLTADCEIKQHIWQWKAKEECSSSAVPCVILIIWMSHNIKWSTIISLKCHYVLTQSHSTLMHLSQLSKVFKLSCLKLDSCILLALQLVTSQVMCHCHKNNSAVGKVSTIRWIYRKFPAT